MGRRGDGGFCVFLTEAQGVLQQSRRREQGQRVHPTRTQKPQVDGSGDGHPSPESKTRVCVTPGQTTANTFVYTAENSLKLRLFTTLPMCYSVEESQTVRYFSLR